MQQLATGSAPIPELTTACEELRTALTTSLSSSIRVLKADAAAPASPVRTVRGMQACVTPGVKASAAACHSPSCHHVAHMEMTGHQGGGACGSMSSPRCCNGPHSPSACCYTLRRGCGPCGCGGCGSSSSAACCCSSKYACSGAAASGRAECSALLSGCLFDVGLTPAANRLQLRMDQLDQDLR